MLRSNPNGKSSLEEMLDQIREEGTSSSPEETVLPDGTVKVKRKKRRSNQPVYEKRKKQRIKLIGLFLLSLLSCFLVYLFLEKNKALYRSDSFSENLNASLQEKIAPNLKLEGLGLNKSTLSLDQLHYSSDNAGKIGSAIRQLSLKGLSADTSLMNLISKKWALQPLKIEEGSISLNHSPLSEKAKIYLKSGGNTISLNDSDSLKRLTLERLEIENLDVAWGNKGEGIFGTKCFISHKGGNQWGAHLEGGNVKISGWKNLQLHFANLVITPKTIRIETSKFGPSNYTEVIDAKGSISLDSVMDSAVQLALNGLPTATILEQPWSKYLKGFLHGNLEYSPTGMDELPHLSGQLELLSYTPEDIPFWKLLSRTSRDLTALTARDIAPATAQLYWTPEKTVLQQIRIGRMNAFILRGDFSWNKTNNNQCVGQFQFGINENVIKTLPEKESSIFGAIDIDGYQWTSSKVSGTLENPKETFSVRIK